MKGHEDWPIAWIWTGLPALQKWFQSFETLYGWRFGTYGAAAALARLAKVTENNNFVKDCIVLKLDLETWKGQGSQVDSSLWGQQETKEWSPRFAGFLYSRKGQLATVEILFPSVPEFSFLPRRLWLAGRIQGEVKAANWIWATVGGSWSASRLDE